MSGAGLLLIIRRY